MAVRVVLLGAPGVGKGTQGRLLSERFGIPQVATGEILREAVKSGSPLGLEVKERMENGLLVPDETMIDLIEDRLGRDDVRRGFVLDGFPRTLAQAQALDRLLDRLGMPLQTALYLSAPIELVVGRLASRLECPVCHTTYNPSSAPPKVPGVCDRDGTALVTRADDDIASVRRRIEVYFAETEVLRDYYEKSEKLAKIDATRAPEVVFGDVIAAVERAAVPERERAGS